MVQIDRHQGLCREGEHPTHRTGGSLTDGVVHLVYRNLTRRRNSQIYDRDVRRWDADRRAMKLTF